METTMTPNGLSDSQTIVVGASRGLGRGIATVLADSGTPVVAVARSERDLTELTDSKSTVTAVVADATDAALAGRLIDRHQPRNLVLVAGASPLVRPVHHQTWETFSANWETDVRMTFHWLREALLTPLEPGSRVVVMSSGAALQGSPLSGGYAGAKATQRFIAAYAQDEADRANLGITFTSILPRITPLTELGRPAVEAYAARSGLTHEQYMEQMGPPVTPEVAGGAVLELLTADADSVAAAYVLTGAGLKELS
jgi:NAD(P)-dependent dehydrogenase (short-subunit alcohol dehydrogenase family)